MYYTYREKRGRVRKYLMVIRRILCVVLKNDKMNTMYNVGLLLYMYMRVATYEFKYTQGK